MNIPNKLTIFRVLLIPVYMILYLTQGVAVKYAAIGVFILAALTDQIDGYLALKNNQITTFGKLMDPLADKMLISLVFRMNSHSRISQHRLGTGGGKG